MRKRIEGEEGVSEIGDIEQLEEFLNNRTKIEIKAIKMLSIVQNKTSNPLKCFERLALRFNKNKTKQIHFNNISL